MPEEVLQFDQSRPAYPPKHFESVLGHVANRNHFLDLGIETGQTFFSLYHQFSGDLVGVDSDARRVEFALRKAQLLLPSQAVNRTKILSGDVFEMAQNFRNKFDLVTVGSNAAESFGSADRLLGFAKDQLLDAQGTLAVSCVRPESLAFEQSFDEKENVQLQNDFEIYKDKLSEYTDLSNNPIFNTGVQMRYFTNINQINEVAVNLMDAQQLVHYLSTMPSYNKYINDRSNIDRYALQTFQRKVNERIAARATQMSQKQSLIRVSHRIMTFLLKK